MSKSPKGREGTSRLRLQPIVPEHPATTKITITNRKKGPYGTGKPVAPKPVTIRAEQN